MKLNLLDCILRDSGYYNNWNFSQNLINDYLKSIYSSGIEYAEIGFGSFNRKIFK